MLQGKPRVFTHGDKPFCHMCNNRGDVEGYSDHSNNVAPAEGEINKGLRLGLMMAAKRHDRTWYAYGAEGQRTNHGSLLDMDIVTPATGLAGPRGQDLGGIYIYRFPNRKYRKTDGLRL